MDIQFSGCRLQRTRLQDTGPYFGAPFDFGKLSITQVGTGALTFTDHDHGTFAYTVEANSTEKPITRLSF